MHNHTVRYEVHTTYGVTFTGTIVVPATSMQAAVDRVNYDLTIRSYGDWDYAHVEHFTVEPTEEEQV